MPGGRVLMIAHHFPPAAGSGSNRALAFARYLPECGWQPTVLTPGAIWAIQHDAALEAELPAGLRVVRTRSFEPKPTRVAGGARSVATSPGRRVGGRFRSHVGHLKRFPDAHLGWLPFALAAARREQFDLAYSSSGPFTSHLVGLMLKRLLKKPWVAELRDGWYRWNRSIFPDYPLWRDALERRLEAIALRSADRVVLVTERMADAFRAQYADLPREHFTVVANGFDRAQVQARVATGRANPSEQHTFEVLHSGALYYGRSVQTFLAAARRLMDTDHGFEKGFRLRLLGTLDGAAQAEISRAGLDNHVQYEGQVDHAASLDAMRRADLLLLVANTTPGAESTVPGKLFEYLAIGQPILALAPRSSSTRDVLDQTGGGYLASADDVDAVACALKQAFDARQTRTTLRPNPNELAKYDRKVLAGELARIFDEALSHADSRRTQPRTPPVDRH